MTPRLQDFAGDWRLSKVIADRHAGQAGRFAGQAAFVAAGTGLAYREWGMLTLGDAPPLAAQRRYLWRAEGPRIVVDYADGRRFHAFDPGQPAALHLCDPDRYAVTYDFGAWPDWTADWLVTGPRKDYAMSCRYSRG
jgi:hypothetical protein